MLIHFLSYGVYALALIVFGLCAIAPLFRR